MRLTEPTQGYMQTLFEHIASTKIDDSPDGPNAQRIKALGSLSYLNPSIQATVLHHARLQLAANRALFDQHIQNEHLRNTLRTTFTHVDPIGLLEQIDTMFPPLEHPELDATVAAFALKNTIEVMTRIDSSVPA